MAGMAKVSNPDRETDGARAAFQLNFGADTFGTVGLDYQENDRITSYNVCYTKLLRITAGVPVTPGSQGNLSGLDEALERAAQIGYPIMSYNFV